MYHGIINKSIEMKKSVNGKIGAAMLAIYFIHVCCCSCCCDDDDDEDSLLPTIVVPVSIYRPPSALLIVYNSKNMDDSIIMSNAAPNTDLEDGG